MSPRRLVVLVMALMLSLPLAAGTLRVGLLADGGLEDYAGGLLDRLFTLMPRVGRLEVVNYNRHQEAEARRQASAVHEAYAAEREVGVTTPASYVPYYESSPVYEIVPLSAPTDFIDSLDEAMLSHLSRDLDLVFVFLDSPRDSLGGLEVWLYIEGRLSPIFSSLYVPGSLDGSHIHHQFHRLIGELGQHRRLGLHRNIGGGCIPGDHQAVALQLLFAGKCNGNISNGFARLISIHGGHIKPHDHSNGDG